MPGSSNWIGEFMILLGVFRTKIAIATIAFAGVLGAAYYTLRLFIGTMHNRVGPQVESREVTVIDAVAIVPLVLVILLLAFYPQFGLTRSQRSVTVAVAPARILSSDPPPTRVAER
jgi:NADH-quinone oxidoreductase subunit M